MGLHWIPTSGHTIHLGISVGFQLSQRIRDEAALAHISSKLVFWGGQHLSQAGRLFIANQVILAGIWYSASCTDLLHAILTKSQATVRDFIWSGKHNHKARAKVAWDYAIQLHGLGGVKLHDFVIQASSLLTKLFICGLCLSFEPWKVFILHRLNNIRLVRHGTWLPSAAWLSTATKIRHQGSNMFIGV